MVSKSPKYVKNGTDLAEALGLPVSEGRAHYEGTFYKRPHHYPCAFFDRRGYIIVDSEAELIKIAKVSGERVNIQPELSRKPGYQVGENWQDWPQIESAHREKKAKKSKAHKALDNLSDEEKRRLIDKLKE